MLETISSYNKAEEPSQYNQPKKESILRAISSEEWSKRSCLPACNLFKAAGAQNDRDKANQRFMTSDSSNMREKNNYERRLSERRCYKPYAGKV